MSSQYTLAHNGSLPRERLLSDGVQNLTDRELVSILLGSGFRGRRLQELAQDVLEALDADNYLVDPQRFLAIPGLGQAKVCLLAAVFELARRTLTPLRIPVTTPAELLPLVGHYADRKQETFLCFSLNGAFEVIGQRIVSIGLINRTMVHPREVFADPLTDRAAAIICAHNHPSGRVSPSQEDRTITRRLRHSGRILGIQLLDHIIFSRDSYYSFQEEGLL